MSNVTSLLVFTNYDYYDDTQRLRSIIYNNTSYTGEINLKDINDAGCDGNKFTQFGDIIILAFNYFDLEEFEKQYKSLKKQGYFEDWQIIVKEEHDEIVRFL